jgi:hypothetical protein
METRRTNWQYLAFLDLDKPRIILVEFKQAVLKQLNKVYNKLSTLFTRVH